MFTHRPCAHETGRPKLVHSSKPREDLSFPPPFAEYAKYLKLAGFRREVNVGDILEIQHSHERALFRVVWLRVMEKSSEKQIGAECVEPDTNTWDTDFPTHPDEYEEQDQ